jgi:hypothetical protein
VFDRPLRLALALLALASTATAQSPEPSPVPIKAKQCPPPEGFRSILHLIENNAPTLQAYPVQGQNPPKDLFKYFGADMEPRCALERTIDDHQKFKSQYASLPEFKPRERVTPKMLLDYFKYSQRGLKRYQWTLLLYYAEAPEHQYVGRTITELKEGFESMFSIGLDAGKKYVEGVEAFLAQFKGLENTAVDAKKRLDEDEKRKTPRPQKEVDADLKTVEEYEKRFQEMAELEKSLFDVRQTYKLISAIHAPQKWGWPAAGNPAAVLLPLATRLQASEKLMKNRGR